MEALNPPTATVASVRQLLVEATAALAATGIDTARLDAEVLLASTCGIDRAQLYLRGDDGISEHHEHAFRAMLARRLRREPLAYIVGQQEFWSLDFLVNREVLIPRPETELLVELALRLLSEVGSSPCQGGARGDLATAREQPPPNPLFGKEGGRNLRLCDVGTGSGCIAVALAWELAHSEVWALDVSAAALSVAAANAMRHGVAERIRFIESDLFSDVGPRRFDAIIANPPYVSSTDFDRLQPEIRWEPELALDGGCTGLGMIERVMQAAPAYLADGGYLLMEIGADQEPAVRAMASAAQLTNASVHPDYAGLPRVLVARR